MSTSILLLPTSGKEFAHRFGHKRTKSAGSNSYCTPDFGLYTATGLYAHQSGFHVDSGRKPLVNRFTTSEINVAIVDYSLNVPSKETNADQTLWQQMDCVNDDSESDESRNCGILNYRPKCLQRLARIEMFVFLSCILVTLQQALSSGYFNSYFGTNRHIPVWIGKGVVVTGIGSLLFAVPHFMETNNPLENVNISGPLDDNICHIPTPALHSPYAERASHYINPPAPEADPSQCRDGGTYRAPHILIFMLAMVLIGSGGTPIFSLGTIYIDDHVKQENSSIMVGFGLVCGFLLGGYFITIHENSFGTGTIPADIYNGHPKWIGAWWMGFILLGILLILISFPFFAFPKKLKKHVKKEKALVCDQSLNNQKEECSSQIATMKMGADIKCNEVIVSQPPKQKQDYGRNLKDIPSCMWRLLTNPVYIITCLGSCMELCIVSGFLVFLPKYLETQFTINKSNANLYAGGIAVPGACIGIFLGGYILKRFQMKPKGAIQFVLFFNIVCMGLYTALYFLGCDNIKMAGATHPYFNSTQLLDGFQVNLTADCNMGCGCSPNDIEPICGENGITYFSPCHAGCKIAGGPRHIQNYSNCACIKDFFSNQEVRAVPIATSGPCPQMCQAMPLFLIILFVVTLAVSINQMPLLTIILRSVDEEERAFALGMQFVLFRLFAYIPSPILFGNVIDSTCLLWKAHCGRQGGFCLMYNIEHFRLRYVGVCSGLKVAAGLLFFLDWLLICWTRKKSFKEAQELRIDDFVSSVISLDQLSAFGHADVITQKEEMRPLGETSPDSDYNSANDPYDIQDELVGVSAGSDHPNSFSSK
ncbi:solute carrier organic anion transporter family member 5A1-like protein [Dinothrombium tinctorium]|uniref:Solute carrier organic anion transporter family member n=1 Tax=Dinothrombium tinctorium TaxID=1965070 RepID=A0A443R0S6_9ACAR|nr:solute carrier organic anion transporter family member 5A1-like protein [Dinothrombium tinctorium]